MKKISLISLFSMVVCIATFIMMGWSGSFKTIPKIEDDYDSCRSKFTLESDCFNVHSVTDCLEIIEQICGSP